MQLRKFSIALAVTSAAACARDARPTQPMTPAPQPTSQPPTTATTPTIDQTTDLTAFIDPGDSLRRPVLQAMTVLYAPDGKRIGSARFVETGDEGLDLFTSVESLPAGPHAYHVHVYGDCSTPDFKSAGPHFHFTGSSHDQSVKMITGNLGELSPDAEGRATHRAQISFATLQGRFSLLGRAVVIHAKPNDPAVTPDGGAGDRIACGVIGVANPEPPSTTAAR